MTRENRRIEGNLIATDMRFALVVGRWNHFISDRLVEGAMDAIVRHGGDPGDVVTVPVPGSFELPMVTQRLARSGKFDAIIGIGVLIRGATPHFDYIASEVTKGLSLIHI